MRILFFRTICEKSYGKTGFCSYSYPTTSGSSCIVMTLTSGPACLLSLCLECPLISFSNSVFRLSLFHFLGSSGISLPSRLDYTPHSGLFVLTVPTRLPWWSVVKSPPASAGDVGSILGSGRSPGEGNDNPLLYSCLGNPTDRGGWRATVHGVAKNWT